MKQIIEWLNGKKTITTIAAMLLYILVQTLNEQPIDTAILASLGGGAAIFLRTGMMKMNGQPAKK